MTLQADPELRPAQPQAPPDRPVREGLQRYGFNTVLLVLILCMAVLVIYPIIRLLYAAFFNNAAFSTTGISQTFNDRELPTALKNTALLLVIAGGIAMLLGTAMAWLNERTDARWRWAAGTVPVLPLLVPPVASAIAWVFLLAPHAGYLNVLIRSISGTGGGGASGSGPINVYTMGGIIFVTTVYVTPFAYLVMSAAFRNLDPALEEASRMSGVGPFRTLFRVTLPAVRSSLATSAVLVCITIVALFSIPIIIGTQTKIDVLPTLIFRVLYTSSPPRLGEAVILSSFMLAAIQLVVLLEYGVTRRGRHAVVGGRAQSGAFNRLGGWRWPIRLVMIVYLLLATVLPLIALVLVSLQRFWSANIVWARLSMYNYRILFETQSDLRSALINSLILGALTASVLVVVSALVSVYVRNSSGFGARSVNVLMTLPSSIPHTAIAIGFLIGLGTGQASLAGTRLLLFLSYVVLFVPVATRAASAARSQIGDALWESSVMSGASSLRTFRSILLPLMLSGLMAGWVVVFVQALSEMSASVFLSGGANPVVGPVIMQVWQVGGTYPRLAALTTVITIIQIIVVSLVLAATRGRRPLLPGMG